jgi:histidyl-tRNA synthetase
MTEKRELQAIKGTRDLLPPETELWNRVESTAREVFSAYGFGEIRPPILERTRLFERAVGSDTDIVSKEMFNWVDDPDLSVAITKVRAEMKKTQTLPAVDGTAARMMLEEQARFGGFNNLADRVRVALRPEATASVCRAYIEHGMQALPQPVKLYYMGPMFRRERPQKGRYRQFYQIGAELLELQYRGQIASKDLSKDAAMDAEVIEMVMMYFRRLELYGAELEVNSIGHNSSDCRRGYIGELRAALEKVRNELGTDSQRRIETNPLRVLDSKVEREQAIIEKLPRIGDSLCDECKIHYAEVKRQLEMRGVPFRENWRLVRGLDYYMRTTFEITAQGLGSQNAVCGGGRYDGLVELLGGPPVKGIGFAIGEDRLILSLQEAGKGSTALERDVYVAWMVEEAEAVAIAVAQKLRESRLRVELPLAEVKLTKALGQASKVGARYALILGKDEIASREWTVKNLTNGKQEKVRADAVVEFLKRVAPRGSGQASAE